MQRRAQAAAYAARVFDPRQQGHGTHGRPGYGSLS